MSDPTRHSIITHWQKFTAKLGVILGCSSVDDDITSRISEVMEAAQRVADAIRTEDDPNGYVEDAGITKAAARELAAILPPKEGE